MRAVKRETLRLIETTVRGNPISAAGAGRVVCCGLWLALGRGP